MKCQESRINRIAKRIVAAENGEQMITIDTKRCPMCGKRDKVKVYPSHLKAWQSGIVIQKAMPELNTDEREQMITGICGKCWNEMFKRHK